MEKLSGAQRKFLRSLAHGLKPCVHIGHRGITATVIQAVNDALDAHELIKVKYIECREKERKAEMADQIQAETFCDMVGAIGHTAIFFRIQKDPAKRKITLPL
ncbi:MAG: YhbY family RNA-binding protein [Thermodesulfobacteriota bacterium]